MKTNLFFPTTLTLILILFASFGCNKQTKNIETKNSSQRVARGKQLVNESKCNFCHTPVIETEDGAIPDLNRLLSGHPSNEKLPEIPNVPVGSQRWLEFLSNLDSTVWAGEWGISFSANLTPDKETGIGKWTEKDFLDAIHLGKHPGTNKNILPPMPWMDYANLDDEELKAIFSYLKTIKPVKNPVPEPIMLKKDTH